MSLIGSAFEPTRRADEFDVVLDKDAVVEDGEAGGRAQFIRVVEAGRGVNDVVNLPFAGGKACIRERRVLAVNGAGGTIRVSFAAERIEDLHFVAVEAEEDAAISAALAFAVGRSWCGPFDVELAIAEVLERSHVSAASDTFHVTVL